jgi:hypothetical protein
MVVAMVAMVRGDSTLPNQHFVSLSRSEEECAEDCEQWGQPVQEEAQLSVRYVWDVCVCV